MPGIRFRHYSGFFMTMDKQKFKKTGTITKVNRKTGEVTVLFARQQPDFELDTDFLFVEIDGGLVPFFVAEEGAVSPEYFRVLFADWEAPGKAQRLVGCSVFVEEDETGEPYNDHPDWETIIGFEVIDENKGRLGKIADVFESSDQVLLQVFVDETEILIPFTDAYLPGIDMEQKIITLDLPDGLLELYLDE